MTIRLPPLVERTEDIPELVRYFIARYASELGVNNPSIQPEAISLLQSQAWPGNVRELENVVRESLLRARPFGISVDHIVQVLRAAPPAASSANQAFSNYIAELLDRAERGEVVDAYWKMIAEIEGELFLQAIDRAGGNQAKVARWLGVTRLKVREKLSELGWRTPPPPADNQPSA
jgi:DNA-binding NtrC family response regulator